MGLYRIENTEELQRKIEAIGTRCSPANGNLLINHEFSNRWIEKGQVSTYQTDNAMFLLRKRNGCSRCYFLCEALSRLPEDCKELFAQTDDKIITSVLDRGGRSEPLKDALRKGGFSTYTKLDRVSVRNPKPSKRPQPVDYAKPEDLGQIKRILDEYFDPLLDQNPDEDEIAEAIESRNIIVARLPETGMVVALQSFEKIGRTLYGRYMVTMDEYRKQVPEGGTLWRRCIKMHDDVNAVIGWIVTGNEATLRWNQGVGLNLDGVTDEIFLHCN